MKAIKYFFCCCLLLSILKLEAQHSIFLFEGRIEFERKLNLYAQMDEDNSWSELQKKAMPKFKSSYFDLLFSKNKTIYQPGRENPDNNKMWMGEGVAQENVVFSDLDSNRSTSQKKVFETIFLIQDTTRRIKWKITDETRAIAGFQCRRANAIIMDSIYVVAFYTDEIITPGGPESFTGLPGMILGVSMPHQHVSWFATKVAAAPVTAAQLKMPTKGKKVTNNSLMESLKDVMKDWGKYKQRNLEAVTL